MTSITVELSGRERDLLYVLLLFQEMDYPDSLYSEECRRLKERIGRMLRRA